MQENDFVARLSAYLDARTDLTPSRLSIEAGLDNSAIRALLSGKAKHPRLDTALAICSAIGTTLERFMSADLEDLRAGKIPRLSAPRSHDPIDQRILDLLETLEPDERLRLLGYAEGLTARHDPRHHAPSGRASIAPATEPRPLKEPETEGPR